MQLITVWIPEFVLEGLHELVRQKKYPHRSELIRNAIRDLLKKELSSFIVNKGVPMRTRKCSKCRTPLELASNEGGYFCANCKSVFPFE